MQAKLVMLIIFISCRKHSGKLHTCSCDLIIILYLVPQVKVPLDSLIVCISLSHEFALQVFNFFTQKIFSRDIIARGMILQTTHYNSPFYYLFPQFLKFMCNKHKLRRQLHDNK